jgi:Cysteine rich repeat
MRSQIISLAAAVVLLLSGPIASAQQSLVETVARGCETELKNYCQDVTPGEGRILSCLYAYGDKLSGQCEFALYDAAAQLERFVASLSYVANECDQDIDKYCASVEAGEGRILACLEAQGTKIQGRCTQALEDVGLK